MENIILAQGLGVLHTLSHVKLTSGSSGIFSVVYPLLKFSPAVRGLTAVVCGASLVSGKLDDDLNSALAKVIGITVKRTLECRQVVCANVNLKILVMKSDEAAAAHAGATYNSCWPRCGRFLTYLCNRNRVQSS
eukprot:SAG31_NODE_5440_length_2537_cov_2.097211_4_plen_134_part_00